MIKKKGYNEILPPERTRSRISKTNKRKESKLTKIREIMENEREKPKKKLKVIGNEKRNKLGKETALI